MATPMFYIWVVHKKGKATLKVKAVVTVSLLFFARDVRIVLFQNCTEYEESNFAIELNTNSVVENRVKCESK